MNCTCSLCQEIKIFHADPGKEILRVATAQSNRSHMRQECKESGIDMEFQTERKGRPYILVSTKTRYRYDRRLKEYEQDLKYTQMLAKAADTLPCPIGTAADLRQAVSNARL